MVEAELGGAFNFAEMQRKLIELQAANPGIAEQDFNVRAVLAKQAKAHREGGPYHALASPCSGI